MGREHGFDKVEYETKKIKEKDDEDKKKAKKTEFDDNPDKDKDDPKSLAKRMVIVETMLGLR